MKLTRVDVRFFRSFNFDFERKARDANRPDPWEDHDPWHPFVRVPLERDITAVVGANESGKSQLLHAIEAGLTGDRILREDFCRYSDQYSVQTDQIRYPEFGVKITLDEEDEIEGIEALHSTREFVLYRPGARDAFLVVNGQRAEISSEELEILEESLPKTFRLETGIAVPDSVSIAELSGEARKPLHDRSHRAQMIESLLSMEKPNATEINELISTSLVPSSDKAAREAEAHRRREFELAYKLLVDAAQIDPHTFSELKEALASGREGQVEGLVGSMNAAIRENLNVQRWWTQDRQFDLVLEAREYELAFTIRDRTGATYSFGERSQGLRYFLSYFVQLTAHRLTKSHPDILLLDEPDAYLSSVGQQDLLRLLHDYASPEDGSPRNQVIYVTHSPFLLDKNAPERIRVLAKGDESEGTRVVRDAANNRYEPLRSSLGAYVAETAFISGQNLFVEGISDQILIAGISAHLSQYQGSAMRNLDMNEVTIVAAGGADSIPYMVYLARGRDTIKPPCVALLDGDQAGREAQRVLKRGEARKKRVLKDDYIVRLDVWAAESNLFPENSKILEIEDLIPLVLAHRAALAHLSRFKKQEEIDIAAFSVDSLVKTSQETNSVWKAISSKYSEAFPEEHIEKVGFARELVLLLENSPEVDGAAILRERFASLLEHLSEILDSAATEEFNNRSDDKIKRSITNFVRNHPKGISKYDARRLLRELTVAFQDSDWADEAIHQIGQIRREHELEDPTTSTVQEFVVFKEKILALGTKERLEYQDDSNKDPAAALIDAQD